MPTFEPNQFSVPNIKSTKNCRRKEKRVEGGSFSGKRHGEIKREMWNKILHFFSKLKRTRRRKSDDPTDTVFVLNNLSSKSVFERRSKNQLQIIFVKISVVTKGSVIGRVYSLTLWGEVSLQQSFLFYLVGFSCFVEIINRFTCLVESVTMSVDILRLSGPI